MDRTVGNTSFMLAEITFSISDQELVFADLTNKLTSIYGQPDQITDNNSYIVLTGDGGNYTQYNMWNVWYGTDNTGVYLYKKYSLEDNSATIKSAELRLVYGRTDGKEYLDGLDQAKTVEQMAQDQLIQQQNANDINGL